MKTTLLAAAATLMVSFVTLPAYCGEANHEPFGPASSGVLSAPNFNTVTLLPTNGQNGAIQTASALPSAPEIGGNAAGQVAGLSPALRTGQNGYATAQLGTHTLVR